MDTVVFLGHYSSLLSNFPKANCILRPEYKQSDIFLLKLYELFDRLFSCVWEVSPCQVQLILFN